MNDIKVEVSDLRKRFGSVEALRGADDRVCPRSWCTTVSATVPGARYTEVPGHRHETMIRDPQEAAVRILA
ncbi:MAG: hypothetical protein J0I18_15970, partial [Actinobacteria bacterium]|nr:hypothetical protein [Actinomycetota bacterium]